MNVAMALPKVCIHTSWVWVPHCLGCGSEVSLNKAQFCNNKSYALLVQQYLDEVQVAA
jgi:hypothetical protein